MKLYIMRHGQAELTASSDQQRELTIKGIEETSIMAKWLKSKQPTFDISFVSPYIRAQQTFDIISQNCPMNGHHYCLNELVPEASPANCGDVLLAYCAQHCVKSALVVSHLPLVSLLISDLCKGDIVPTFSTSSIACIDIDLDSWMGNLIEHRSLKQILMGC